MAQASFPIALYDLVTVAVAVLGYLFGRSRGFAWQVSGLVTLVGGGLCATILAVPVSRLLPVEGILSRFLAWILVYAVMAVCLYVLTLRFKHRLDELEFGELDRRFGGLLGLFQALIVFSLLTLVAVPILPRLGSAVKSSFAGRGLQATVHELRPLLPEKIHMGFGPYLDAVSPYPPGEEQPTPAPSSAARPSPVARLSPRPSPRSSPGSSPRPRLSPAGSAVASPSPQAAVTPIPRRSDPWPSPAPTTARDEDPGPDPFDPSTIPPDPLAPE